MRTTIQLEDTLLTAAKDLANRTGRTLSQVVEDALREVLARRREGRKRARVKLTTHGKGGVRSGVDLDDSAALLDVMEGRDGPA